MGRRRRMSKGLAVNGILLLNKRSGFSSNAELQRAKALFNACKAGHTGSLDPLASGLLPICFGEGTKVSAYLLDGDKRYRVKVRLGIKTDSGDKEGEIVSKKKVDVFNRDELIAVLKDFEGEIAQIPPMYSALKHRGERLYKLARQGIEVERKARNITIHHIILIDFDESSIELDVLCSKGTYIRTLAEDVGEKMGCGAHVEELRRTEVNHFLVEHAFTIEQLEKMAEAGVESLQSVLLPVDEAVSKWPELKLDDSLTWHIQQGQSVPCPEVVGEGLIRLYDSARHFIGLGSVNEQGQLAAKRLFNLSR